MSDPNFTAARSHVVKADDALLPSGDTREALKSIFDAVENVFKQLFSRADSLNGPNIQNYLKPAIEKTYDDPVTKRAALKNLESFRDWVDGVHNYRHEPGHQVPVPPPHGLAVLIVSQGINFVRWLAELLKSLEMRSGSI